MNNAVVLGADQSWYSGNLADQSGLYGSGNLNTNGHALTITGNGLVSLGGVVSGSGSIAVSGSSNCSLGLFGANTYTGGTFLTSGEVQVTSDSGLARQACRSPSTEETSSSTPAVRRRPRSIAA